ncbi:MAG TPA: hypothetical protein PK431_16895 [Chitinophagales bacterium]|nr:hypothetical protein [Chitinophagales bacterium]
MYLTKKIYIGANYEHNNVKGVISLTKGKDNTPVVIDLSKVTQIEESAGYWRKANHIHKWFVANVQDGEDDCGEYHVTEENLQKLLHDCKSVKENNALANELLPPKSGFFFGSTDIDEYYMNKIDYTIEILENIFKTKPQGEDYLPDDYYYNSSW